MAKRTFFLFFSQVSMIAVTVGFVIGKATSTRQSPIYKAVLDLDTGMYLSEKCFLNYSLCFKDAV